MSIIKDEESAQEWLQQWLQHQPEANPAAWDRLEALVRLLTEENIRQNLISAASLADIWRRHIADSAQLLCHVSRETWQDGAVWLDLGTGAGFPGLIIAILRPEMKIMLVESRQRRIDWLKRARTHLGLEQVQVLGMRLEQVPDMAAHVISARAFAPLDRLVALAARFSTNYTHWLLPKGRSAAHELHALSGWRHMFHVKQSLTDAESGIIMGELLGADVPFMMRP